MVRFGQRQSDCWREKVSSTAGLQYPLRIPSGKPNPDFPWAEVRLHTDCFLKKEGKITQKKRDTFLRTLIQKHGATVTIVAACAHAMSPEAVRSLLADENDTAIKEGSIRLRFLRAVVAAHHVNPQAITESESNEALGAMQLRASRTAFTSSQKLEKLIGLLIAGDPDHSLTYPYIRSMAQICSVELSNQVQVLRGSCSWMKAHAETKWLSTILDQSFGISHGTIQAINLLDDGFPDWKVWAECGESYSQLSRALKACWQPHPRSAANPSWTFTLPTYPTIISVSRILERITKLLVARIPKENSVVYEDAHRMTQKYAAELSSQVQALQNSCQWLKVHSETKWLSMFLDDSIRSSIGGTAAIELLNEGFPAWRAWAEWGESNSRLAQALTSCSTSDCPSTSKRLEIIMKAVTCTSRNLDIIIKAVIAGIPSNLFPYPHIRRMIQKYSSDLSQNIKALTDSGLWLRAHEETKWLSGLLYRPLRASLETIEAMKLLQEEFTDWSAWAKWGESDSQLAQTLIPYYTFDSFASLNPKILPGLLMAGVPVQSLLRPKIHSLLRKFSVDLAKKLQALEVEGQWLRAYKEAEWLPMLLDQSIEPSLGRAEAIQVLEDGFPDWRAWAEWRPDIRHLNTQAELTTEQRCSLQDFHALDGPDFAHSKQATMRDGLVAQNSDLQSELCWGTVQVKLENQMPGNARDILERISNAVEAACRAGSDNINLFIYLCCNGKLINDGTLRILERINILGENRVCSDLLHVLEAKKGELDAQRTAIMQLLPLLSQTSGQELREALLPYLVNRISTCMQELQALLRKQLDNSNLVMELHVFGVALQAAPWLLPLLNASLGILISNWPTTEKILDMNALQSDILRLLSGKVTQLRLQLNEHYTKCLIETSAMDLCTGSIIEALIHLWHQKPDTDRRELALVIAQGTGIGYSTQWECLRQLPTLPDTFVRNLRRIWQINMTEPDNSCVKLVQLLATTWKLDHEKVTCWRLVLHYWIKDRESTLLQYTLTHLTVDDWFQWLSDLYEIFPDMEEQDFQSPLSVLQPALHAWAHRIRPYSMTISRIENGIGSRSTTKCLLMGFNSNYPDNVVEILKLLEHQFQDRDDGEDHQSAVLASIALLNYDYGINAKDICQVLSILTETTRHVHRAYLRVIEAYQVPSPQVVPALLVGWLQNPDLSNLDKQVLEALGNVLGIRLDNDSITKAFESACDYVTNQVTSLLAEVERLSGLRRSLKAMDPEGTYALLAELEIDDNTSPLEDEIASLSLELVDVIELVGENAVELHFPLTHHTALQRTGMGTNSSQSLVVRLVVGSSSLPSGFCMHFDNELKGLANSNDHSPRLVFDDSSNEGTFCHGHVNHTKYQLGHILSRYLLNGSKSLEETYNFLKLSLGNLSQRCIVCGMPHGVRLRRSTVCQKPSCYATFLLYANFNIHLHDLQADIQVGDLLLTAVQAAATSGNMDLLPDCQVGTPEQVTELLGRIPSITTMQASEDLPAVLNSLCKPSEFFLKWIFTNYNGFLLSASGPMRIPSMPGIYQFLLANAAPRLEKAFAAQLRGLPTKVVFHGTSLERLYAILCQGLRVCSGSPLQRHGAAYGNGIYVAEEPATAMRYATAYTAPVGWKGWHGNTFDHARVLLGCEASGHIPSQMHGIHVIADPDILILRYIFLIPQGVTAPIARHIVPAMTSVFASLRSGDL